MNGHPIFGRTIDGEKTKVSIMSFKFLSLLLDILLYVRTEMQHDATSRIHSNTNAMLGRFARLQATNTTSFNQVHPCPIPMFGVLQSPANCDDMTGTEWKVEPSLIEITRIPKGKRSHRKQKKSQFHQFPVFPSALPGHLFPASCRALHVKDVHGDLRWLLDRQISQWDMVTYVT